MRWILISLSGFYFVDLIATDSCTINSRWTLDCQMQDEEQLCALLPNGKYSPAFPLLSATICAAKALDKTSFIVETMKANPDFANAVWHYQNELNEVTCWEFSGKEEKHCKAPVSFLLKLLNQVPQVNTPDGNLEDLINFSEELSTHLESKATKDPYGETETPVSALIDTPNRDHPKYDPFQAFEEFKLEGCKHPCFLEKEPSLQRLIRDVLRILSFEKLPERIQLYCLLQELYLNCESDFIAGAESMGVIYNFINIHESEIAVLSCPET